MNRSALNEPDTAWRCVSTSEAQTRAWGHRLGTYLRGGDVVALIGELGAGKTRFVQGLAEGLGAPSDGVSSPTFTIRHDHVGRVPLLHLDFYRLRDPEEVEWLGMLESPGDAVIAVEWADRLPGALPDDHLEIVLRQGREPDERAIEWTAHGPRADHVLAALRAAHAD